MIDAEYIYAGAILFASSLCRATFGFGDALIAMPLLTIAVGVKTATPIVAFFGLLIAVFVFVSDFRNAEIKANFSLIISSIVGIPLGLLFLTGAAEFYVKLLLGVVILSFSVYRLLSPSLFGLKTNRLAPIFGLIAGALGGAYNTNGPPIIIFGALRQWDPANFRAILQGVFLPTNIFIVAGHGAAGLWSGEVFRLFLYNLPLAAAAIFIGGRLNKAIPAYKFVSYVYMILIAVSLILIFNTILSA